MKKILIATRNKDKFQIVTKILESIDNNYQYSSLYDIDNLYEIEEEKGSVEERAYTKAKNLYSSIKKMILSI